MSHYADNLHYTTDRWSGYERLRVDAAQTSFWEGREFRSFVELNLAAGASLVVRFTAGVDFVLFNQRLLVDEGKVRMDAKQGGTPGGTFTNIATYGKNRMVERRAPYYTSQIAVATGGTHTGGTVLESLRVNAGGASGQAQTVGASASDERGLPAGTYYIVLTNYGNGVATGTYDLWWEERSRHPDWKHDLIAGK